jgi:hypothetical protein
MPAQIILECDACQFQVWQVQPQLRQQQPQNDEKE